MAQPGRRADAMKVPPFTLVQQHYFAAAVECGSMTAASRELMVSQPAVTARRGAEPEAMA
jgi:regulatory helix-turn-helix LysR family protein